MSNAIQIIKNEHAAPLNVHDKYDVQYFIENNVSGMHAIQLTSGHEGIVQNRQGIGCLIFSPTHEFADAFFNKKGIRVR